VDQSAIRPDFGIVVGHMARDLAALFQISSVITSIRDIDLLQREILQLIFEVVPAENGAIVLRSYIDEGATSICTLSRNPDVQRPITVQHDLVQRAFWERSAILANANPESDSSESVLCLPLMAVEKAIGVIYLTSPEVTSPFGEDHVHFLGMVSRITAVTIENILALDALNGDKSRRKDAPEQSTELVGGSRKMGEVEEFIRRVSQSDSTVLIRGESGTGKELVARAIHNNSPRSNRPFVAINCAAIPEALLESELFGHERGAYTGAVSLKIGRLEAVGDGTLFLDEIGELAPSLQAKLLRVLQQREFERLGGNRPLAFKGRVLAATNKALEQAIKSGEFRQDLYYRLNVVSVTVPPLRERREDIPMLALYFADRYAGKSKRTFKGISREARALLMRYNWPGNVRELENAIEHAIVLGRTEEILPGDLPQAILGEQASTIAGAHYHEVLDQAKREMILCAIRGADGNYPQAARLLGIHPKYLHRLVRNLDLKSELH
jgi:transcriptional regulator with GAF, ATPase, and Fis domain